MARSQLTTTVYTDDLTGETLQPDEVQTVTFAIDKDTYELDLSRPNADTVRATLKTWISVSRRTAVATRTRTRTRPNPSTATTQDRPNLSTGATRSPTGTQSGAVRDWARSNGHTVPSRGRIPSVVQQAFDDAHKTRATSLFSA